MSQGQFARVRPTLAVVGSVYRAHFVRLFAAGLIVMLAFGGLEVSFEHASRAFLHRDAPVAGAALGALSVAAGGLGYNFMKGVGTVAVADWRAGRKRLTLTGVARELPWLPLLAIDLVLTAGTAVGLLLLVVPGIVFANWFALAPAVVEIEQRGVWDSLRRGAQLVRGRFWLVLAIQVLVYGSVWAFEALLDLLPDLGPQVLDQTVFALLAGVLVKPLGALAIAALAFDAIDAERAAARQRPGAPAVQPPQARP